MRCIDSAYISARRTTVLKGPSRQKGITLLIALVALLLLMFAGVAMVRSFEASTMLAGNLAFKRDMINQAERGLARGIGFINANKGNEVVFETSAIADNYSAIMLPSDSHGVPQALIDDSFFSGVGSVAQDIVDSSSGVTIRYVIDRQCEDAVPFSTDHCTSMAGAPPPPSGSDYGQKNQAESPSGPVYRISVRVTGPRDTRAYAQATVSPPAK